MDQYIVNIRSYLASYSINKTYNQKIDDLVKHLNVPLYYQQETDQLIAPQNTHKYYHQGYFFFYDMHKQKCVVISSLELFATDLVEQFEKGRIFLAPQRQFVNILANLSADFNTQQAATYLEQNTEFHSARSISYNKMVVGFGIMFFSLMLMSVGLFNLINGLLYFIQNSFKSILLIKACKVNKLSGQLDYLPDELPIYTILIPLYKEELKVGAIIKAISLLDYPKDKLDVKLIVEEDDVSTNKAVSSTNLPDYVHLVKVPYSFPRTKPKALNYAMSFAIGEYLTIYDAEDEPEALQLKKSLNAFAQLHERYACVQSRLNFYNANENMLTKMFSIEYSVWFNYLLKGLSLGGFPVPLGGTSNHFRVKSLKEVGLWDAYNVTEDADLGIRLYLRGYRVQLIDSITMEEAPSNLRDWIAQRARWTKGFLQTLAVFMKTKNTGSCLTLGQIFAVYIFVGISTYIFIFLPWLLLFVLQDVSIFMLWLWLLNGFLGLAYMYISAYVVMSPKQAFVKLGNLDNYCVFFLWPFYFLLHTIASYRAIWEVIKSPFQWNKTPHGSYEKLKEED